MWKLLTKGEKEKQMNSKEKIEEIVIAAMCKAALGMDSSADYKDIKKKITASGLHIKFVRELYALRQEWEMTAVMEFAKWADELISKKIPDTKHREFAEAYLEEEKEGEE